MLKREPTVTTTIRLPESVYYPLRALCIDPTKTAGRGGRASVDVRGVKYDTWNALFVALAKRHLAEQQIAAVAADEDTSE